MSLLPKDVTCLALWSKDYKPLLPHLDELDAMGTNTYFNFTITGLPSIFECNVIDTDEAIAQATSLSRHYLPRHICWRYDPIVMSSVTDEAYHIARFEYIASRLKGYVEHCYFSFPVLYDKVQANFAAFSKQHGITFNDPSQSDKMALANSLATIAAKYSIQMYSCCGEYLVQGLIRKAHCLDADVIETLYGPRHHDKPTRTACGCAASVDIGGYDSCPHGCVYCYANKDKAKAEQYYATKGILLNA
jgi:hypothetical protein